MGQANPSLFSLYARAILPKKNKSDAVLPSLKLQSEPSRANLEHLQKYRDICGFKDDGLLPLSYPAVTALNLQLQLMSSSRFPFRLMGMVHLGNRFEQKRALRQDELIGLNVYSDNLKPHDKGLSFELITEAAVDGEVLWRSIGTMLVRIDNAKAAATSTVKTPRDNPEVSGEHWHLASNLGRRYARISGDINPIHLTTASAKLLGFKRHIMHGMWTLGKTLATVQGSHSDNCSMDIEFKTPIFLPAEVIFSQQKEGDTLELSVHSAADNRPHMLAQIKAG